jgi:hypothetical protein
MASSALSNISSAIMGFMGKAPTPSPGPTPTPSPGPATDPSHGQS